MISDYIKKIKANTSIYATKKTSSLLDGTYTSVFMGRSLNFEDLREYIPGDNIRDIDWKASSRNGSLLVKRFVAERKHNIMFVLDTGLKMSGDTNSGTSKKEIALLMTGTLSYLAYKNGDNIGAVYNNDGKVKYHQLRTGLNNVEKFLTYYEKDILVGKNNDIEKSIQFISNNIKTKMVVVIVTDLAGAHSISEKMLKQLKCRHDVLVVNIGDADMSGHKKGRVYDLEGGHYIPEFISRSKRFAKIEKTYKEKLQGEVDHKLIRFGISNVDIDDDKNISSKVIELLENHRNVNIH